MKRILVVDDEAIVRESLKEWLEEEGYKVETAEQGEEALQKLGKVDFGVMVLDLRLPGKDGIEVLKEAKEHHPDLKSIIITAYPSVETALKATRLGALDYLVKPFAPSKVDELIREVLGPAQPKIRPEEAVVPPAVVEEAKAEGVITVTPEEIPVHLERGKEHFNAGRFREALREFEAILHVNPGNIENRVWLRKTKQALVESKGEVVAEEAIAAKLKECVWAKMGMVSYRLCTSDYDCLTCDFDQGMQEKMAQGETAEFKETLARFKELPGSQRLCRYALKGDVSHRLCTRLFQCATCEFGQLMQDALEQKLAKLAARREALLKKARSTK